MLRYVALGALLVGLAASPAPKATPAAPQPAPTNPFNLIPIPRPSGTSLPYIGGVRSKPLCTAIRRAVAPAVAAALRNDQTYGSLRKTIFDYVVKDSEPARDLHLMQMDRQVDTMVKNIDEIETSLKSPALDIPGTAKPEDAKAMRDLKTTLTNVLTAQKTQLNVMSGFVETERMRRFGRLSENEQNLQNSTTPNRVDPRTGSMATPIPVTGFLKDQASVFDPQHATPNGLRDGTRLDQGLGDIQAMVNHFEDAASKVIIPAANSCK